ncbi:Ig-like domain-containing alpha-2-macroglobulin family protein [uncultured Brachyspira sp.]|uniref:Ig-like domain-containing alpha-2-macroglobulin family protein n=2 Tax=uncultured Brachyspira sp. TaxID=221953 RepID=UPI0025DC4AF3|nr:Ig-like domain-containing alpha-2-macroglobulin family protein [uncultured Brachyspira sp.]
MKKLILRIIYFTAVISFIMGASMFAAVNIDRTTPIGENVSRNNYKAITVTFNQQMIALQALKDAPNEYFSFNIDIKGYCKWLSINTLAFYPEDPLPDNTAIEVTLKKGIKSELTGDTLENDYTWTFNTVRPIMQKSSPYNGQSDLPTDVSIVIYYNMPIYLQSAREKISLIYGNMDEPDIEFDIRYARSSDLRGWETDEYELEQVLVLTPKNNLYKNGKINVYIDEGLAAVDGNLGTEKEDYFSFSMHNNFYFNGNSEQTISASYYPESPKINFSTRVQWSDLIRNIEIEPSIQLPAEEDLEESSWSSKNFDLYQLRFNPNTTYNIKINGSLKDIYGQTLGKEQNIILNVTDYNPSVSIPSGMGVVESYEGIKLPVNVINPNTINIKSRYVDKDNIIPFLFLNKEVYRYDSSEEFRNYTNRYRNLFGYDNNSQYIPNVERNKYITTALYLTNYMNNKRYGLLSIEFSSKTGYENRNNYLSHSQIQITSMGVTGKFSGDSNTIFVTDLKTGMPVEGAAVEIRDDFNRVLETAITDRNGIANTKGFRTLGIKRVSRWSSPRQWAIVTKGDDISFINSDWGMGISPWRMDISYNDYPNDKEYEGSMFTERGIYKPGEEVHIKGVIRENKTGNWQIPDDLKSGSFIVNNSRGEEIHKGTVALNEYGSYLVDFTLPADAPTGYYSIEAEFQNDSNNNGEESSSYSISQSFRVEEFKPLEYESRIWVEDKSYYLGDTMPIKMSGWYLFGEPMISNQVNYNISIRETSFTPPNNAGFRFKKLSWFEDEYYNDYYSSIANGTGSLDENGEYAYAPKIDASRSLHAAYVTIESTVAGNDSQKVSATKNVLFYGSDYYIGIKRQGYFLETDKPAQLEFIAADPDGNRLEGKKIEVKIIRRYWESVKKAITGGRFQWESKQINDIIETASITTAKDPVILSFTPEKSGLYIVQARAQDSAYREVESDEYMYVIGKDYAPWAMFDDDLLELITEKEEYKPYETAKIMVKSPYESATALITVEREYVMDSYVTNIEGSTALIEIPIKPEYLPNIYVGVSLVKGRVENESYTNYANDEGKPSFKIGYAGLSVSPREKELNVKIIKSADSLEPRSEMTVDLYVETKESEPMETEIMLSVVDVGVLNLIGYKTPNWFNTFYGKRPLSVSSSDTRIHLIGQRNYGEKGDTPGGDGMRSANALMSKAEAMGMDIFSIRKNFLTTAFYQGRVKTDAEGKATVTFNLPDNITSFRIMASAINKDGYFGASDDVVVVKKNIMLMPTLPEFAYVEDKLKAGTLVYNYSDEDLEIEIQAVASNAMIENDIQTIKVAKGAVADVRFDIAATNRGDAKVTILARGGEYTDAVEKSFEVNVPMTTESVAVFSSTTNNNTDLMIRVPNITEAYKGAGSLEVYMSPSAFSELTGGINYLINYPYLCLEQQLSKVYPIITSKRLLVDMKLTDITEESLDDTVQTFLKNMPNYQSFNGGFSYWTSKTWISPWLTAYAADAMIKAEKEGYTIDKNSLKSALEYIRSYAESRESEKPRFWDDEYINLSSVAYIAAVLAEGGYNSNDVKSIIDRIYPNVNNMPFYGQVQLMRAMYYNKYDNNAFAKVRQYILNTIKEDPNTAHYELEEMYSNLYWIHSSSVRDTSVALYALIETGYDNTVNEKVVRWLVQSRKNGRYLNTQDNVSVFAAMNMYFKKYENVNPDFKAEFIYHGQTLMSETFSSRTQPSLTKNYALDEFMNDRLSNLNTKTALANIKRNGNGRLYYGVRLNYAPRNLAVNRDAGIKVEREYHTKEGKVLDLAKDRFKQGEEYVVVVKVTVPYERHFVAVDTPIAAGMRILNSSFDTESSEVKDITGNQYINWWGGFNHTENYNDKILLFADVLNEGEHIYKYVVRAVTPGEYLLPATKAEEMYNSEVFGYDGQHKIIIETK